MGRYRVVLDPEGYKHATEPGFHWFIDGRTLAGRFASAAKPTAPLVPDHNFWNPDGTDWLLCKPRQFASDWYADSRLDDHVIRDSAWTYAASVTHEEWQFSRKPGSVGHPFNQWITLSVPETLTSLDDTDYTALGAAAGIVFPTGMGTVAFCEQPPVAGVGFKTENSLTPHFQHFAFPEPDGLVVFGWGQFALILSSNRVVMLYSEPNDRKTWSRLGEWSLQDNQHLQESVLAFRGRGTLPIANPRATPLVVLVAEAGPDQFALVLPGGKTVLVKHDPEGTREHTNDSGSWFIGAAPRQRITHQTQVVGYEEADTLGTLDDPAPIEHFKLGAEYKPTVAPDFYFDGLIHVNPGSPVPTPDQPIPGDIDWESDDSGERLELQLTDTTGVVWVSDGTLYAGSLRIHMIPSTKAGTADGGYLAPAIRIISLRFPVKLEDRAGTPLILDDHKVARFSVSASLESDGKRLTIDVWDSALLAVEHRFRDSYPVHIEEDVDGDGTYETLRAVGWITEPNVERVKDATGLDLYRITGKGVLSRCAVPWMYLPQFVNPLGPERGIITHTFAVKESLHQRGFDVDDPTVYEPTTDPWEATEVAQLPGQWQLLPGENGKRVDSPWAPEWDQTVLEYIDSVSKLFRGWMLYETLDGLILYHPNLMLEILLGAPYWATAVIYRDRTSALNASKPGQYALDRPTRQIITPEGNVVRITGKDQENLLVPHILDRRLDSMDQLHEDFIGEWRPVAISSRMDIEERAMRQRARVALLQVSRRRNVWPLTVPIAPHRFLPSGISVGDVVTIQGETGAAFLVTHLEWDAILSSTTPRIGGDTTRLVCERLPLAAVSGTIAGDYPGRGDVEDEEE